MTCDHTTPRQATRTSPQSTHIPPLCNLNATLDTCSGAAAHFGAVYDLVITPRDP